MTHTHTHTKQTINNNITYDKQQNLYTVLPLNTHDKHTYTVFYQWIKYLSVWNLWKIYIQYFIYQQQNT